MLRIIIFLLSLTCSANAILLGGASGPQITSLVPLDGAIGVDPFANLQADFNQDIVAGTTILIQIFEVGSGSPVITWNNASIGSSLFINPTSFVLFPGFSLSAGKHYCIKASAGSLVGWSGISNETTWDFFT